MANVALSHGPSLRVLEQLRLLRFGVTLVIVSVFTLFAIGATNQIAMTVVPAVAGLAGLGVEEFHLHRRGRGRRGLHHSLRAALVGSAVFAAAVVIATAT
ncbi:MAG: hypothetical protein AAGC46_15865 [Solirubrobacteraceae bacterium]|nr:hypothetical protein [Patulibacter sp.]